MHFEVKVFVIGLLVGYVSGLFGKGGSAIGTPLLQLIGIPPFFAIVTPLPATIPGTLVSSLAYLESGFYDKGVVLAGILGGIPATILGAWLSKFVEGRPLLIISNLILIGLGLAFLLHKKSAPKDQEQPNLKPKVAPRMALGVAVVVGFVSGMLANSGGFLLAPLYNKALKLPLKSAFACSLLVSAALAVPGTIVHLALGHIDWSLVLAFGMGSVPLAYLGARTAIKMPVGKLEFAFGILLVLVGGWGAFDSISH